jgi:hypothetical protein
MSKGLLIAYRALSQVATDGQAGAVTVYKAVGFCVCAANSAAQPLKGCDHWEPMWEPT